MAEKEGIIDGFRVVINSGASACKFLSLSMHVSACLTARWPQELKHKSFPHAYYWERYLYELLYLRLKLQKQGIVPILIHQ